jgi:hypothetical protein
MTWILNQIAPAPHLLEPAETEVSAYRYGLSAYFHPRDIAARIAEQKRAIEHEEAIVRGMERAYQELVAKRGGA